MTTTRAVVFIRLAPDRNATSIWPIRTPTDPGDGSF
jgi:hypothetical protein